MRTIFEAVDDRRDRDNGSLDSLDRAGFARLMTDPKVARRLNSMIKMQQMLPVPLLRAAILRKQRLSRTAGPSISTWRREEGGRKGSTRSVASVSSAADHDQDKDKDKSTGPFLGQYELDQLAAAPLRDLRTRRGVFAAAGGQGSVRGTVRGQGWGHGPGQVRAREQSTGTTGTAACSGTAAGTAARTTTRYRRGDTHERYGKAWSKQLSRIANLWQASDPKVQAAYLEKFMGLDKAGEPPPYSAVAGTEDVMDNAVGQVSVQNQQFASPFC